MQNGFSPSAYTYKAPENFLCMMGFTCAYIRFLVLEFDYNYFSPNFFYSSMATAQAGKRTLKN